MKGLLHGLLLGAEMPENTELILSVLDLDCIYCKRVTSSPGCQMVIDHWFYSRDKAVLWRLRETKYLILTESDSLLEPKMESPIVPSSPCAEVSFFCPAVARTANHML